MRRQSISELTDDFRIGREPISDLPELIDEDFSFGRQSISELTDDFRIGREPISDLPELIDEDFSFGRQSISELPGERILKCLEARELNNSDSILMKFFDGGKLFKEKVHDRRSFTVWGFTPDHISSTRPCKGYTEVI